MRIGTFLIGGVLGAAAVMLFTRSSNKSNVSMENSQSMWNTWMQSIMNRWSAKPGSSKDVQFPTAVNSESLIHSSMSPDGSKQLDQVSPAN